MSDKRRCGDCTRAVEAMLDRGYTYSAMSWNNGPWHVVFSRAGQTFRGDADTLHDAIRCASRAPAAGGRGG